MKGNQQAAVGCIFVCCACGKVSATKFGFIDVDGEFRSTASPGWDESCMLKARSFPLDQLEWNDTHTRVVKIRDTVYEIKS